MNSSGGYIQDSWVPCRTLAGTYWPARKWHAFLITSVATPFVLALPVILWQVGEYVLRVQRSDKDKELVKAMYYAQAADKREGAALDAGSAQGVGYSKWRFSAWNSRLQYHASRIVSDQMLCGQFLKLLAFLCAMGSLFIYFHDTAAACVDVEQCEKFTTNVPWQIDLAFNCYLLLYYILRFCAHHNKLWFVFQPISLADYFTIPPVFVAIGLQRNWYGLRFLRIINLLWLVELLRRYNAIRTVVHMQLARLTAYVIMAVVIGAGSFLLLECAGDPWDMDGTRIEGHTFWNMAYFSVVTISTVGYGDLGCKTLLGRLCTSLYIFACLFFIASFIASAASLVPSPQKYPRFDNVRYFHHVLLCGHINVHSLRRFLTGFYAGQIPNTIDDTFVIVIHADEPDGEMLMLLHDYQATVEYIKGSPLDDSSLDAAQAKTAHACLILSDYMAPNMDAQDSKNILMVAALKGYCRHLRVQVQVSKPNVAAFLRRHYDMHRGRGDIVTSMGVVQTGLVGKSGIVPGFVPFCLNLLSPRPLNEGVGAQVLPLYRHGQRMRLDSAPFAPAFYGMTFAEAAQLCFDKLQVLLISVYSARNKFEVHSLVPNPRGSYVVRRGNWAQVIAPSSQHAKAVENFCTKCHHDITTPLAVAKCACFTERGSIDIDEGTILETIGAGQMHDSRDKVFNRDLSILEQEALLLTDGPGNELADAVKADDGSTVSTDSTGHFHWCPPREFEDSVKRPAQLNQLSGHIIILLTDSANHSIVQISNILLPLRKRFIPAQQLKEVLVVCRDEAKLREEWQSMNMLPRVTPVVGDPIKPAVLRACAIQECDYVIILSSGDFALGDEELLDHDAVIMTAHIRSIEFDFQPAPVLEAVNGDAGRRPLSGRRPGSTVESPTKASHLPRNLRRSSSVDYRCTVPYMSGSVLPVNDLQDLMVTGYQNPSLLNLFTALILGGDSRDMVHVIAEGVGLLAPSDAAPSADDPLSAPRTRAGEQLMIAEEGGEEGALHLTVRLRTIAVASRPLRRFINKTYGELFAYCNEQLGVLCLALYRQSHLEPELWGRDNRYVATFPPADTLLQETDQVYCLFPASCT